MNPSFNSSPSTIIGQLQQSMSGGQPALGQVSSQSPTFDPTTQTPPQTPMPQGSPLSRAFSRRGMQMPQGQQAPTAQPTQQPQPMVTLPGVTDQSKAPGVQVPVSEAEKLIGALEKLGGTFSKRLDVINGHEEAVRNAALPSPKV